MHEPIYRKIIIVALLLTGLIAGSTISYIVIEGWSFFDALYMTIISVATVGYGEIHNLSTAGRIVTMVILVLGVGIFGYAINILTAATVEGHLKEYWYRKKMQKNISKLKGHYIICGYGRIGKTINEMLQDKGYQTVILENHQPTYETLKQQGQLHLYGDATQEDTLLAAGLKNAKGIVCVLQSDPDNVYITLTARGINPPIMIIARASDKKAEKRLLQAGATKVISPYEIGAKRMALAILKPTVIDFLDLAMHSPELDLNIEQVEIAPQSQLDGVSMIAANLRQKTGVTVLAIHKIAQQMMISPRPEHTLTSGDVLVVMGTEENLNKFKTMAY